MAKIAISLKLMLVWLYNAGASVVTHSAVMTATGGGVLSGGQIFALIFFILIMVFLPEILFVSWPIFRKFIMEGVQDGDGITHTKDIKQMGILYVSLWSMRLFLAFGIAKVFGSDIGFMFFIAPLIGSFGTAGLAIIKDVAKR